MWDWGAAFEAPGRLGPAEDADSHCESRRACGLKSSVRVAGPSECRVQLYEFIHASNEHVINTAPG